MTTKLLDIQFEQIPDLLGKEVVGDWFSIPHERREAFDVSSFTDTNTSAFNQSLYPDGLIEGFQLVSLLDHFCNLILRTDPTSCTGWNYGLDRVRFITPVTVDTELRLRLKVADVRPKDEGYVLSFDCVFEIKDNERPAFMAKWLVFWLPVNS